MTDSPQKPPTDSYSRTLPEVECFELLAVGVVGRIGFVSPAGVQILPVNYRLGAGHRLFFKTAPRGALAQLAEAEARVAFEVDYHAADFQIAWSVLMNGTISAPTRCRGNSIVRGSPHATRPVAGVRQFAARVLCAADSVRAEPLPHEP